MMGVAFSVSCLKSYDIAGFSPAQTIRHYGGNEEKFNDLTEQHSPGSLPTRQKNSTGGVLFTYETKITTGIGRAFQAESGRQGESHLYFYRVADKFKLACSPFKNLFTDIQYIM